MHSFIWHRLLTAGLQGKKFASWTEALLPDEVLLRVLWIIENTLNAVLLEKVLQSTGYLLDNLLKHALCQLQ